MSWEGDELSGRLSSIVTALMSTEEEQAAAVQQLADLIDNAEGEAAEAVGKTIRDFGAMDTLLDLLDRPETQQHALRVIGNLASNAVDSKAEETKRLLHDLGAFPRVMQLIFSEASATVVYALGAVQNMLTRPEYAAYMLEKKADLRLRALLQSSTDSVLRHFAQGCLSNMTAVSQASFKVKEKVDERAAELPPAPSVGGAAYAAESTRALVRYRVPADNSCLFTTCALLCDATLGYQPTVASLRESARRLRTKCAELVRDSPEQSSTLALLGHDSIESYAAWITDETRWGGEPEVSMLSELFDVEITVAACDAMNVLHYGGGRRRRVVYILYTGQHYDPLIGPPPEHARSFPPLDEVPRAAHAREADALRLCEEHNEAAAIAAVERSRPAGSLPSSPATPAGGYTSSFAAVARRGGR